MGYYTKAAETYLAGLEVEPTRASGFFTLGNCYFQTKEYATAIACYQMALEQDPTLERVKNNLELAQEMVLQVAGVA
jgi:tetratricopeptide (TPR) repeat protein